MAQNSHPGVGTQEMLSSQRCCLLKSWFFPPIGALALHAPGIQLTTRTPRDQFCLGVGRCRGHHRLKRAPSTQTPTSNVAHVGPRDPSTNWEECR
jgi:hypothetical protein